MRERRLQPFGAARRAVYTLRSPKDDLQTVLAKYCTIKGLFRRDGMLKHPLMDRASLQHDLVRAGCVAVALHPRAASGELVYPTESVNPLTDLDRADDPCNPTVVQPADAIDSSYAAWNSDSEMQCDDAGDTRDTSGSDDAPGSHAPTESVADTCARNTIDAVTHDGPTGTSMPLSQIAHMASDTEHSDADRADSSTPRASEVEPGPRGLSSASPTLSL